MSPTETKPAGTATLGQALFPVVTLAVLVGYGLIYRPFAGGADAAIPLELIFILAAAITVAQLLLLGHKWIGIQDSIVAKFLKAMPAFFILFSIGLVIGSWMICGTIPMLVFYGLKVVDPTYLYLIAFLAPVVFSTLTGTSYGSAGTIGVVIIGIAMSLDAHLGITAGAIIGGAYFGDKMSPLSDTTNLAALAAEVDLYDHIRSMMYTTVPSAIFAAVAYTILGFIYPPQVSGADFSRLEPFLDSLSSIFSFNILLLIPPLIVLVGSLRRMPTVPVLLSSVISAVVLTFCFQNFSVDHVFMTIKSGFDVETMSSAQIPETVKDQIVSLLNRGGLYSLQDAIVTAFMVFIFIGAMDHIKAMPTVINYFLKSVKTRSHLILASLGATAFTNSMTSNQYATSFIVGDAFKEKYDEMGVNRNVLSRSLEDTGTMLESIVPWTVTALYMVDTLGVPFADYWCWQLLSLSNIVVAVFLAITGIGCFYKNGRASE